MKIKLKNHSDIVTLEKAVYVVLDVKEYDNGALEDLQDDVRNLKNYLVRLTSVLTEKGLLDAKDVQKLLGRDLYKVLESPPSSS